MAQDLSFAVNLGLFMDGNFDSQFKNLDNALSRTAEKVKALGDTAQRMSGFASMAEKCQKLTGSTGEAAKKLEALKAETATLDGYISQNAENTARLTARYNAFKAEADRLSASGQKNTAMYQRVAQRMKQLKVEIKGSKDEGKRLAEMQKTLTQESSKLERSLNADTEALEKMKSELQAAGVDTNNLAAEQERLTQQAQRAEAAQLKLANAQSKLQGIRDQLSWNNIKGDLFSSAKYVMAFKQPIEVSKAFNQAMANVKAVTGASDEDFAMLRGQAQDLGATTQFSAMQAANTQENLARAGLTPAQIRDMMPSVLAMAASDGMDLATAGDILAGSVRGYGLNADQGARVADLLAFISANSQTNVTEAGAAFQSIAGTGQLMGVEVERMGAYIGVLANRGITGTEAATAIERSLQALAAPTTEAAKTLRKFGVATKTKGGGLRYIDDIAKELLEKTAKLGSTGQMEAFKNVFGKAYAGTMQKMALGVQSGDFKEMYTGLKERKSGSAQKMADVRNDTLQGDLTALGSAWEGLMERIGTAIEPINRYVIQTITNGITNINQFIKEHEGLVTALTRVAYAAAGFKIFTTAFKYAKLLTSLPFAKISVWLAEGSAAATVSGEKFSLLGTIASKTWGLIAAHPFVAIGVAVGTMAVLVYKNWDKIKETAAKCWESVKEFAGIASEWVSAKWQALSDWWNSWTLDDVFAVVAPYADSAVKGVKSLWGAFSDWWASWTFPDVFAALLDMAGNAIDTIKGLFAGLGTWIMDTIGKLNPFNWELPSWLGGGQTQTQVQQRHDRAMDAINMLGGVPGFATGGIIGQHAFIQVAENGPEAIIPLNDKARGTQLLLQAADALGVNVIPQSMQNETYSTLNQERGFASSNNALSSIMNTQGNNALSNFMNSTGNNALSNFMNTSSNNALSNFMNSTGNNALSNFMNSTGNNALSNFMNTQGNNALSNFMNSTGNNAISNFMNSTGNNAISNFMNSTGNNALSNFMNTSSNNALSSIMNTQGNNALSNFMNGETDNIMDISKSIERSNLYVADSYSNPRGYDNRYGDNYLAGQPQINITVNSEADNNNQGLAELIAQKVKDAWQDLQERQERVAFA